MITAARHFGGSMKLSIAGSFGKLIHPDVAKWWTIVGGLNSFVSLPHAEDSMDGYRLGGVMLVVANKGTDPLFILYSDLSPLATIAVGHAALVSLTSKEGLGTWLIQDKALV